MKERHNNPHSLELLPPLYGDNPLKNVAGIAATTPKAVVFQRTETGIVQHEILWHPWLLSAKKAEFPRLDERRLDGEGHCWLYTFDSTEAFFEARGLLREQQISTVALSSMERQFLIQTGITFFKEMTFEDTVRMQIDIETNSLSHRNPSSRCLMVAVSDNRGFSEAVAGEEAEIFARMNEIIQTRDPDIIEGHNFFGFDLPFLAARASACGSTMAWGRDGSTPQFGARRNMPFGGITRPFVPVTILGRSIIDTLFGVQRYDVSRGELSSHGLKEAAIQLGVSAENRVYVEGRDIAHLWTESPQTIMEYALQDVYETGELARIVMPPDFYISQMVPDTYQACASGGTGEKINILLVREYLRQGQAVPIPTITRSVAGGYTDLKITGLIDRVVKADVESLYPSLMLSRKIAPKSDSLGVFLPILEELTARRMKAKALKATTTGPEQTYWDALQSSFKILINSFYGYLGTGMLFNDSDAAEQITTGGQDIILTVVTELERTGSKVIEVDTDGVYFQPPSEIITQSQEMAYIEEISRVLPNGVHLAHDGRWRQMLSLKVKNYILVRYDGRRIYKGAALRSRADERFGRAFISKATDLVIEGKADEIASLYLETLNAIEKGKLTPDDFCRRERVTSNSLQGRSLKRAKEALKGAERGDYLRLYRRTDGSLARQEDYNNDEDREYLKNKLYQFAKRLAPAIEPDFDRLCPNPHSLLQKELAGQLALDLDS